MLILMNIGIHLYLLQIIESVSSEKIEVSWTYIILIQKSLKL